MTWSILRGDVLDQLATLPDESVHCCVTSPPYWGLRDYGTASWAGGDASCDHIASQLRTTQGLEKSGERYRGGGHKAAETPGILYRSECGKCGAQRIDRQIGLEATPEEFVSKMVSVFAEVRRVLRLDGTCWINMGDSYAGSRSGPEGDHVGLDGTRRNQEESRAARLAMTVSRRRDDEPIPRSDRRIAGVKPKDLVGMPWMIAFALRADGWYLRQDIIWAKPNPMPESVRDRCTKAHEYIFLLSKSERYHYDAEAIRERVNGTAHARGHGVNPKARWKTPDGWDTSAGNGGHGSFHRDGREKGKPRSKQNESFSGAVNELVDFRNKRDVWEVASYPFPEAHFATFPPALVRPCILAGCPPDGTVLDPFSGAGTTGLVAVRHGRNYIGIELNPEYAEMSERRITNDAPLFNTVEVPA